MKCFHPVMIGFTKPVATVWILGALILLLPGMSSAQWDCYAPQPGHPTSAEKTAFVNEISVYAREAETTWGPPAAALVAMACNESGYGFTRIGLYANNLFGWKYYGSVSAGGRSPYTLSCQPSWDPNNQYVSFPDRRDCVMFVAMKLATMAIYKDDTDRYISDIRGGVSTTTAVNRWVQGIASSGYNPYSTYVSTTQKYLNNYMTPSTTFSSTYNLYKYSPATGSVEDVWISIDAPSAGATVAGNVAFNASVGGGTVNTVKFYSQVDGAADWYLINTDTTTPYGCNWATASLSDGPYRLKAEAWNGTTLKATGIIKVMVDNVAYAISITAPANEATVSNNVTLSASVSGGTVEGVKFYSRAADSTGSWYLIATDTTSPYSASWATNPWVSDGAFHIRADAYQGTAVRASRIIAVTVKNAQSQTYWSEFTSPSNEGVVSGNVALAATAAGNPTNNISSVQFLSRAVGSTGSWYLIATDTTSPYTANWATNPWVTDGDYNLKADAYAGTTLVASKTIQVAVRNGDVTAPTVSITAPAAGAVVSGNVTFSATASDAVGVTKVEFYSDSGNYLIATDTTSPYSTSWATDPWVKNGFQTIVVKAYDAAGNVGTASRQITINNASGGITLNQGVDNSTLTFTTGGNANWYGDTRYWFTNNSSIRSGIITHNQSSWVEFQAAGPKTLRFQWRVSSEASKDFLELWIDGVKKNSISGDTTWAEQSWWLASGTHTIRLQYKKDASGTANLDAGFVDYLRLE